MKFALQFVLLFPVLLLPVAVSQAETCSNGLAGYEADGVCCPLSCGSCGGLGCGLRGDGCCTIGVQTTGEPCSTAGSAPCVVDVGNATGATAQTCRGGIAGHEASDICCPLSCGSCGGWHCKLRGDGCCTSDVREAGEMCSTTGLAPCIIDGGVTDPVFPVLTPSPVFLPPAVNPSPTPIMTIPTDCTSSLRPEFRLDVSSGTTTLYAEGEGCFTMTDIYEFCGTKDDGSSNGPIYMLNLSGGVVAKPTKVTKKWLIAAELIVRGGGVFYCIGSELGGDCDEFRIQSTGPDDYHEVRGHGGSLYFSHTIVTSWDTPNKKPQEVHEGGRSFLNCVSETLSGDTCDGATTVDMGECRMDLINSELGYLGWFDAESYGLTWKVRGFCSDLSNPNVFDTTNVYGDILNCDIHHNYYGHYTYGHQGGVWDSNTMHDNWQYGFDPHDDSDYLTISNNEVYGNVNHGIIASKRCNNVKIINNTVRDGGPHAAGIYLHRSSDDAEVYGNTITNMHAGITLLESFGALIYYNTIDGVEFGVQLKVGSGNNNVYDNEITDCSEYALYSYLGSDAPTKGISDGRPTGNMFENNVITNTTSGVQLKDTDDMVVTGNRFFGTDPLKLRVSDAQGTTWSGNTFSKGACVHNVASDNGESVPESTFESSSEVPPDC